MIRHLRSPLSLLSSSRSLLGAAAVAFSALVLAPSFAGCTPDEPTQMVMGVSTQVDVPKELSHVRIDIKAGPDVIFCQSYPVFNGRVQLPRTLALRKDQVNLPITVAVYGLLTPPDQEPVLDCQKAPKIKDPDDPTRTAEEAAIGARVLRRTTQPYIDGRILYIPMPLKYACFDRDCDSQPQCSGAAVDCTCKAGRCVTSETDPAKLAEYNTGLSSGSSSTCFSIRDCMVGSGIAPIEVVDAANCIYNLPTDATNGGKLNVMLTYDEYVTEVLDEDPPGTPKDDQEGFTVLPGGRFQLAFGLCEKAPAHKVLTIAASRNCAPKVGNQPVCNNGDTALTPVDSGAYVLYNPVAGNSTDWTSVRTTIQEAIASPVLSNTKVSINRLTASCFPSTSLADFGRVTPSYQTIAAALESAGAASSTRFAMNGVLNAVNEGKFPSTTNVKALVVITNGDIEADLGCGTPKSAKQIAAELLAAGVRTYVILSDKDEAKYPAGALVNAAEVAKAGGTFNEAYALNKGEAYGGIALSDLSSCKYVKPGHVDAEAELFYVDLSEFADAIPGAAAKPQVIPAVGTCAGATSGWGLSGDKMSIEICGTSCTKVQKTVLTQFALFKDKVDTNTFNAPSPVVWARKPIPQP